MKWDGYRAQLAAYGDGRVLLRSRRGTDMVQAFPEIRATALAQLAADTGLDRELVVWEEDRLAFERLHQRLNMARERCGRAARQWPAHFVVFDLLHQDGTDLTGWPNARRRRALEELSSQHAVFRRRGRCARRPPPRPGNGWRGQRPDWRDRCGQAHTEGPSLFLVVLPSSAARSPCSFGQGNGSNRPSTMQQSCLSLAQKRTSAHEPLPHADLTNFVTSWGLF
ncbi:hypothetical protein [Streptomyces sp. NPDC002619]|uniref:ATP-dependent DNA ligase n=1 Tax=Streptomyces sp. NPDC002619 TaxID=3364655 RepID=UPI0036C46E7F